MNQEKKDWMLKYLPQTLVTVYVNVQREGVDLPPQFRDDTFILLQYGYDLPVPLKNLEIQEDGISAILTFDDIPSKTFIPWDAVFAMTDGEDSVRLWLDCFPQDFQLLFNPSQSSQRPPKEKPATSKEPGALSSKRPLHLKLVD